MPESRFANGTIVPSVFVSLDSTTAGGKVIATAGATTQMFGISQAPTRNAPYPSLDDNNAAITGETLLVYTYADKECLLWITSACNPGDNFCADTGALGKGLVTTTDTNWVGAAAKQAGIAGDLVPVDLYVPHRY